MNVWEWFPGMRGQWIQPGVFKLKSWFDSFESWVALCCTLGPASLLMNTGCYDGDMERKWWWWGDVLQSFSLLANLPASLLTVTVHYR